VNHLDIVTGTTCADPVTARVSVSLSCGLLEDLLDGRPSSLRTTRHERRAVTGTFLTTRNTRANKEETFGLELLYTAYRVWVVGVTTVDDDVALLEVGLELVNEVIDG
jgi:hypothetical protein